MASSITQARQGSLYLMCGGKPEVFERAKPLLEKLSASMRYIALKSAAHFRSGFESIAGSIYNVNAQAIHTHDFSQLPYQGRPRPMFPLDPFPAL